MKKLFGNLFLACIAMSMMLGTTFGDVLIGDFNFDYDLNPIASVGQVTFALNGNGTIDVSLTSSVGIIGFGFDAISGPPESNFSPAANQTGWSSNQGTYLGGFQSPGFSSLGSFASFTIGNDGDYASVYEALTGTGGNADFLLISADFQQYYANAAAAAAPVPEPSSFALAGLGGLGLAFAGYRRRKASVV